MVAHDVLDDLEGLRLATSARGSILRRPTKVGRVAVDPHTIAPRDPAALFRVSVTLAAYQSRRDVDVLAIQ